MLDDSERVSMSFGTGFKFGFSMLLGMVCASIMVSIIGGFVMYFLMDGLISGIFETANGGNKTIQELQELGGGMIAMFHYPWR